MRFLQTFFFLTQRAHLSASLVVGHEIRPALESTEDILEDGYGHHYGHMTGPHDHRGFCLLRSFLCAEKETGSRHTWLFAILIA